MANIRKRTKNQVCKPDTNQTHLVNTDSAYLEQYISSICEYIESDSMLPAELAKQAKSMNAVLERCFEEQLDFSYEFYKIVKDFLLAIEQLRGQDYSSLTVHLLRLGEFMQHSATGDQQADPPMLTAESLTVTIT